MTNDLRGAAVTVMGLGRFGGGAGVTRWLVGQGARVTVTDLATAAALQPSLALIDDLVACGAVRLALGGHPEEVFGAAEALVVNPAVPRPWENRLINLAEQSGARLLTEIGLVTERLQRRRTIGITGTAGKSTTAAMLHHVLQACGCVAHLGGNIGGSLLERLPNIGADDWTVLELSSAMLHWLDADRYSPGVAVMTNLAPNHLDWHGSFDHYRRSKEAIFRHQGAGEVAITPEGFDEHLRLPPLRVPGAHNRQNAQRVAAIAAAITGRAPAECAECLADFRGLPHRLQLVFEQNGVRAYNDSKSTTPEATRLAVEALRQDGPIHLIAGGYDKGIDLGPLAGLARQVRVMYTIGATGDRLASLVGAGANAEYCQTLDLAVERCAAHVRRGDIVLLSPGCASWDQFENYEARGAAFVQVIEATFTAQKRPGATG